MNFYFRLILRITSYFFQWRVNFSFSDIKRRRFRLNILIYDALQKWNILRNLNKFAEVFYLLEDRYSKKIFVEIIFKRIIYRCDFLEKFSEVIDLLEKRYFFNILRDLIFKYYFSPNDYCEYWKDIKKTKDLIKEERYLLYGKDYLNLYNLKEIKYPFELIVDIYCIRNIFLYQQYRYNHNKIIEAKEGDIVIDAGSGWGDTTLYFAHKVGPSGQVYAFEFIPNNVNILNKNINLNPRFKDIIKVIKVPLWSTSEKEMEYIECGTGSAINQSCIKKPTNLVKTISIDDFIKWNNISKIDFIKMDIEGAELDALIGAKETVTKFKPTLAICIYHQVEHFYQIPKFLNSLNLNYKFYIDHFTAGHTETVLFATVD